MKEQIVLCRQAVHGGLWKRLEQLCESWQKCTLKANVFKGLFMLPDPRRGPCPRIFWRYHAV